jgi:hypothetical protein
MAKNKKWTDEQVEAEIERLNKSEFVKLARKEKQIKYRRRQQMWNLQYMEARGRQLASNGITAENMEEKLFGAIPLEED